MREVLQSKIHKANVTEANVNYVGSITIDEALMEKIDLWEGQKVLVVSNTSGARSKPPAQYTLPPANAQK